MLEFFGVFFEGGGYFGMGMGGGMGFWEFGSFGRRELEEGDVKRLEVRRLATIAILFLKIRQNQWMYAISVC